MTHVRVDTDFDAFAGFVSDALAYINHDRIVCEWGHGARDLTGIESGDAVGASLDSLFARIAPALDFAPMPQRVSLLRADESRREIHATYISLDDGWLISFGQAQRFAQIEQLKIELLASVSHELKTPIATIKAFATTLSSNPSIASDVREEYLATIEEQADRLARAVDDLLAAGRVDASHLLQTRERTTVDALLDEATKHIGPTIMNRVERHGTSVAFTADRDQLVLALVHLIENAAKFSADASPIVIEASSDAHTTTICVNDRGIGISDEHIPYLFERFYRVERDLTATTGGTGLGLFIVKSIAHAHGGQVRVQSALHEGTSVAMVLPHREIQA